MSFLEDYEKIKKYNDTPHILPFWRNINNQILNDFKNGIPDDFLMNKHIGATMYSHNIDWANRHLSILIDKFGKEFTKRIVKEEDGLIGGKIVVNKEYFASCNSIHHNYHLDKFLTMDLNSINRNRNINIVEWGGGYGNMPRIFDQRSDIMPPWDTYTIIDTPLFTLVQNHYLKSLGYKTKILTEDDKEIEYGIINLIPVGLLDKINISMYCDVFLAMWSLSESAPYSIEFLKNNKFFGAKKIYLGYHGYNDQNFPSGHLLSILSKDANWKTEESQDVSGHFYSVGISK